MCAEELQPLVIMRVRRGFEVLLDTRSIHRDAACAPMADEEKAAEAAADPEKPAATTEKEPSAAEAVPEAEAPAAKAPENGAPVESAASAAEEASPPPPPVNMVHEWLAAVVIMAILAAFLFGFLFFLRGTSL